jgi:acetyl esterase/lipase
VEFESSPIFAVPNWKAPVLLIHGDDDRVEEFRQSIDLKRRLEEKGVHVEELVLPDDVHDSLLAQLDFINLGDVEVFREDPSRCFQLKPTFA